MSSVGRRLLQGLPFIVVGSLLLPSPASAQSRIFLGGNIGGQAPATGDFTQTASTPLRGETETRTSAYQVGGGPMLDATLGYMFTPWVGAAVAFNRYHDAHTADYSLTVPHPLLFDRAVTHSGTTTDELDHTERAFHLEFVVAPPLNDDSLSLKFFVGPSKLYVNQTLIEDLGITETLTDDGAYDFTIDHVVTGDDSKTCACAWGFHIGADLAKYFTPNVGVGVMFRFERATVDLKDAAGVAIGNGDATQEFKAGGVLIGGGLRLRFP
jgi:hypothetical protein